MTKRQPAQKYWMPVTAHGRTGEYEVSDGKITVRFEGKTKSDRASSTSVPGQLGFDADKTLAKVMLSEEW